MRVLIIGGGIAGTAAALALHQAGFEPAVYEALRDAPATAAALDTFDRIPRPRVENNIAASAALSAGGPPTSSGDRPPALTNEELIRQLSWTTPLSSAR